jgi:hypothetical protein
MSKKMHVATLLVMVGMASGCSTGMVYPRPEEIKIDVDGPIRRVEVKTPRTELLISGSDSKPQISTPIPSVMELPEPEITPKKQPEGERPKLQDREDATALENMTARPQEPTEPQETNEIPSLPIQDPKPEADISTPVPYPSRTPKDGEVYNIIDVEVISDRDREVKLILRAGDGNLIAYSQRYTDPQIFENVITKKIKQVRWRSVPDIKRVEPDERLAHFLIPHYRGPLTPGEQ